VAAALRSDQKQQYLAYLPDRELQFIFAAGGRQVTSSSMHRHRKRAHPNEDWKY
jgi:hypothetical protein